MARGIKDLKFERAISEREEILCGALRLTLRGMILWRTHVGR